MRNMGMKNDMKQRARIARTDDDTRKTKVSLARSIIYKRNYAVNSKPVEVLLKEDSLVPISVMLNRPVDLVFLTQAILECIL